MQFDVRSYCERMKRANPKRFEFAFGVLTDYLRGASMIADCRSDETKAWAFIGPLADELEVMTVKRKYKTGNRATVFEPSISLLELMFAAVCEKLEVAKEEAV